MGIRLLKKFCLMMVCILTTAVFSSYSHISNTWNNIFLGFSRRYLRRLLESSMSLRRYLRLEKDENAVWRLSLHMAIAQRIHPLQLAQCLPGPRLHQREEWRMKIEDWIIQKKWLFRREKSLFSLLTKVFLYWPTTSNFFFVTLPPKLSNLETDILWRQS